MAAPGMRRYRVRTERQAALVGPPGDGVLDPDALFPALRGAPLRLEIGCGHGEFISALGAAHPAERLIGVEYDALRVTKIAHKCVGAGATNVRVFADEAHRFVRLRVPPASVQRVYVLFPDPWPKAGHRRRRLLNRGFLLDLSWAAAPGCQLVVATDAHEYGFQCLSNLTMLPGLWRNLLQPSGYRFDLRPRFETVFERHKRAEGCSILHLRLERSAIPPPPRTPWRPPSSPVAI